MKSIFRNCILLFGFLLASYTLYSQVYPVRADVQIIPPYSTYLSDYAISNSLKVNLRLLQLNRPSYAIGLRLKIEGLGVGITITSSLNGTYDPIYISGGETIEVSGSDLSSYLNPANLIFSGYDKNEYLRTHTLPEGIYEISIEAVDFNRYSSGLVVSNIASTTVWLVQNKPPLWNLPFAGEVKFANAPQNVVFEWSPQHLTSPNGSQDTEYEFLMTEIKPVVSVEEHSSIDVQIANQAIQSQAPFYETVITPASRGATTVRFIYDNSMPALTPGKFYAVRVRAKDTKGLNLFDNDGYTEVIWFRFGEACLPPKNLRGEIPNFKRAELLWDAEANHSHFKVIYKPIDGVNWYEQESLMANTTLTDLQPNSSYEYQVQGYCGSLPSDFSESFYFNTPEDQQPNRDVRCGETVNMDSVDQSSLRQYSTVGDLFKVGAFDMYITEVTGANGTFSGKGEIFIPFLMTKVKTKFADIKVNSAGQVFEGIVKTQRTGLNLMTKEALLMLVNAEAQEVSANSILCDVEPPFEEDPGLWIDNYFVKEGEQLIVTREIGGQIVTQTITVDANTLLDPGNKVTIPKEVSNGEDATDLVIEADLGQRKYSIRTGGNLGYLENELSDLILQSLQELKNRTQDSIEHYSECVEGMSEQILQHLSINNLPKELVVGPNESYLWDGMSRRKVIPNTTDARNNPTGQVYIKHRRVYVCDTALQYYRDRKAVIQEYIDQAAKRETLKTEITTDLRKINQDQLDYYQEGESGYNDFVELIRGKVEEKVDINTAIKYSSNGTSFLWDDNFYETAVAFNGDPIHALAYSSSPDPDDEPLFISPAVRARALSQIIQHNNRQLYMMDPTKATDLPVGMVKEIAGKEWIVAIDSMTFTPSGASFNAFMSIEVPFTDDVQIPLGADQINFTPYGITSISSAKLMLLKDVLIPINKDVQLFIKGGNTYAEIDCDGFKALTLAGEFEFCENLVVRDGINGEPAEVTVHDNIAEGRVKARFTTSLQKWSEFIAEIDIDPFQLKSLPGWGFTVSKAIVDLSDVANGGAMKFPEGYQSPSFEGGNKNRWRGFYLREASVKLPPRFKKKNSETVNPASQSHTPPSDTTPDDSPAQQATEDEEERLTIEARDILIDNMGFTGAFAGRNILLLNEGDMDGWDFSIDAIELSIEASTFKSSSISGKIDVPMLSRTRPAENPNAGTEQTPPPDNPPPASIGEVPLQGDLTYSAVIQPNDVYIFSLSALDGLNIPMFGAANLQLDNSSTAEIRMYKNEEGKWHFRPKAVLTGRLTIGVGLSDSPQGNANSAETANTNSSRFTLGQVDFQELTLQTVTPYVSAKAFSAGLGNQNRLGNFPISINEIGLRKRDNPNEVALGLNIVVNLVGEGDGGFKGECGINIVGERCDECGERIESSFGSVIQTDWLYKTIEVTRIGVDINGGAYKIKGQLDFFRHDPTYGKGFKGQVDAEFIPSLKVAVTALFGEVNGMRYWLADGLVGIPTGIPFTTGLAFYGFGGGAYYHMRTVGHNERVDSGIGSTPSGLVYIPDANTFLGIKAMVVLGTHPNKSPMNGDVTLEVAFNSRGGVNTVSLSGNGYIMTPPLSDELAAVAGNVRLLGTVAGGNASGSTSSGAPVAPMRPDASVYCNFRLGYDFQNSVLHGNFNVYVNVAGVIKGRLANNLAGQAVIHADFPNSEFYIHIGTPDQRNGLKVMELFDLNSYLMTGTSVPDMPPPPAHISSILNQPFDSMRDTYALSNGGGFVMGADFSFDTGDLSFLIFYGRFLMGQGFDIMVKNYGSDAYCQGRSGSLGINGWYAAGQAYAYVAGKVGLEVDCAPIFSGKISILSIGAAAILQTQLPNPLWIKGTVGGYYNVLNGLVKGNCKFEIEVGEKCRIVAPGGGLGGVKVISQVTPATSETDVSVFTTPQAVFNMPVNQEITFTDLEGVEKQIRIKLEHFKVLDGTTEIVGTLHWNDDNRVVAFESYEILPGNKQLKANVKLSFEQFIRGGWQPMRTNGQPATESMETTFTTGAQPDHIPHHNVLYSYPVISQLHFHKDEHPQGYIELKQAQSALFAPGSEWTQIIRFKKNNGNPIETNFTYNGKRISFSIPSELENSTIYAWEIVDVPVQQNVVLDANVYASANARDLGDGADVTVTTRQAEGSIEQMQEKSIFTAHFRTSMYNTFSNKIQNIQQGAQWVWPIRAGVLELGQNLFGMEYFDAHELPQQSNNPTLVQLTADLPNTVWYTSVVSPLMYDGYSQHGFTIDWRATEQWNVGIPPVKAVTIRQSEAPVLTEENVESNSVTNGTVQVALPTYMLSHYVMKDHNELLQKAANHALRGTDSWIQNLLHSPSPYLLYPSDYPVKLRYVLPGTNMITYEGTITLKRN